jgi:hypothetical protein
MRAHCHHLQVNYVRKLEDVIHEMHESPEFCKGRVEGCPEGYVKYGDAVRINDMTGNCLSQKETGIYQLGVDWAQPFKHYTWSTGFIFIRYCSCILYRRTSAAKDRCYMNQHRTKYGA